LKRKLNWRINQEIKEALIRVIGEDGKQIGLMSTAQALKIAQEKGKDLIEIAPKANPPVTKIMELGKFLYQEEKKKRKQKRETKSTEVKEVRFSPFIAEGDYNTRLNRVKEFLGEGNKVRLVVVFKGRQMKGKEFGYQLIGRIMTELDNKVVKDMEPKFLGRHLVTIISPLKGKNA